jgi:hypothetical protein
MFSQLNYSPFVDIKCNYMQAHMNTFKKIDKYGKCRAFTILSCDYCKTEFEKAVYLLKNTNYCRRECQHNSRKTQESFSCAFCFKSFTRRPSSRSNSRSGLFFCSRECKDSAQSLEENFPEIRPAHYANGKRSYRQKALNKKENQCNRCGYNQNIKILQVHHIDENRDNNKLDNLEILCPNCHAEIHWG